MELCTDRLRHQFSMPRIEVYVKCSHLPISTLTMWMHWVGIYLGIGADVSQCEWDITSWLYFCGGWGALLFVGRGSIFCGAGLYFLGGVNNYHHDICYGKKNIWHSGTYLGREFKHSLLRPLSVRRVFDSDYIVVDREKLVAALR